ncbi:uncharacterized protein A1O9_11261 [Exophiala aquamarina CBS 119918]|uniref:Survival Motor Neuron Gemin2-binding domain-containing protein n=1 Tax=Exophiala aquamarina CBS 119918 TaxID=1182545 RepID=A0A072NYA9_9EURO|nr:uncharacterized protein A1O9_11261 [Exophiala aquamarina CBS 119918]KEF52844.1 hypothetical protein A1O9_11261 [Exophiala aquamarina CBS 119918]
MGKGNKHKPSQHRQGRHEANGGFAVSQAEIWDDSALIRSWNDALQEYEYYHSIHARGEDVEEVLRRAEQGELGEPDVAVDAGEWKDVNGTAEEEGHSAARKSHQTDANSADDNNEIEDGEVDESAQVHNEADTNHPHGFSQLPQPTATPIIGPQLPHPTSSSNTTAAKMAPSQDQTLENLKMAYYWAGYYSGLYDGQQKAKPQAQPLP